jgi:hypothetical protein
MTLKGWSQMQKLNKMQLQFHQWGVGEKRHVLKRRKHNKTLIDDPS